MNPYSYYPATYQQMQQQNYQPTQYQTSGFVHVQSENDARNYPVAPGGSVTFIDDRQPYCYTKTMGFSQFDAPVFRKFKLVEETVQDKQNASSEAVSSQTPDDYAGKEIKAEIEALRSRIEALENKASEIKVEKPRPKIKKEAENEPS